MHLTQLQHALGTQSNQRLSAPAVLRRVPLAYCKLCALCSSSSQDLVGSLPRLCSSGGPYVHSFFAMPGTACGVLAHK
jgi:hypothetical protein